MNLMAESKKVPETYKCSTKTQPRKTSKHD